MPQLNSYPEWKTITQSGLETPVWEMEPKAFPNTHDLIWFDLIFSRIQYNKWICRDQNLICVKISQNKILFVLKSRKTKSYLC